MSDENFRMLFQSLGAQILAENISARGTVSVLLTETLKFRDKLLRETGSVLTVADTRIALNALDAHFHGQEPAQKMTAEQSALAQIYIDRLTMFNH